MRAAELTMGRTFVVHFDHGDDSYTALADFCSEYGVRQGFIPMFVAGMREVEFVGTCEKLEDPDAPVWSAVHLENVEAIGAGTLAREAGYRRRANQTCCSEHQSETSTH